MVAPNVGVESNSEAVNEILRAIRSAIPVMEDSLHKGQMGRIGVLGGSKEYTGAPYFAGITALYCGADLVHVLCADAAAQAIKCYSPELIVHPTLDNNLEESLKWLSKLHAVVIGPGLGMVENIPITEKLMEECIRSKKPMIIDADGLYIVAKNASLVSGSRQVILTPNVNEFSRLYKTILGTEPSNDPKETSTLASALGNLTIIRKGPMDVISNGEHRTLNFICLYAISGVFVWLINMASYTVLNQKE